MARKNGSHAATISPDDSDCMADKKRKQTPNRDHLPGSLTKKLNNNLKFRNIDVTTGKLLREEPATISPHDSDYMAYKECKPTPKLNRLQGSLTKKLNKNRKFRHIDVHVNTGKLIREEHSTISQHDSDYMADKECKPTPELDRFPGSLTKKLNKYLKFCNIDVQTGKAINEEHAGDKVKKHYKRFSGRLSDKYEANLRYRDVDLSQFKHEAGKSPRNMPKPEKRQRLTRKNKQVRHKEQLTKKWRENLRFLDVVPNSMCGEIMPQHKADQCKQVESCQRSHKCHTNKHQIADKNAKTLSKKLKANSAYLTIPNNTPLRKATGGDNMVKEECKDKLQLETAVKQYGSHTKNFEMNTPYVDPSKSKENQTTTSREDSHYPGSLSNKCETNLCYLEKNTGTIAKDEASTEAESGSDITTSNNIKLEKETLAEYVNMMDSVSEKKCSHRNHKENTVSNVNQLLPEQFTNITVEDSQKNTTPKNDKCFKPNMNSPKKRLDEIICFLHSRKNPLQSEVSANT